MSQIFYNPPIASHINIYIWPKLEHHHINGSVQDHSISIALAMEILHFSLSHRYLKMAFIHPGCIYMSLWSHSMFSDNYNKLIIDIIIVLQIPSKLPKVTLMVKITLLPACCASGDSMYLWYIQYIPRNMHTVLLCFALLWLCNHS